MAGARADEGVRRAALRDFLRSRRARLTPADVGLAAGSRRRTPGLRREEVALLADVGLSWYTWLEQGREINVSVSVLDAVSGALRLDRAERAYLHALAGMQQTSPDGGGSVDGAGRGREAPAELQAVLDSWMPRPAMVQDRHWNLIAINDSTRQLFGFDDRDHNCLVTFFTNRRYRDVHPQWAAVAPDVVAAFRADSALAPGDPGFTQVADELSSVSPEFAELWARHDVGLHVPAVKAVRHPDLGDLWFDTTTLAVADHAGWHVVLYNPRPGTTTAERLDLLGNGQPRTPSVSAASSSR